MKERPILFSGAMVRAILDGSKTQTRRIVKPQPVVSSTGAPSWTAEPGKRFIPNGPRMCAGGRAVSVSDLISDYCPYGQPGERLWVRETFMPRYGGTLPTGKGFTNVRYRADDECRDCFGVDHKGQVAFNFGPDRWRPSIFCLRQYSRITLEIIAVRVERLQEITAEDCRAEGHPDRPELPQEVRDDAARDWYMDLWIAINGPGSWDANPYVWVVEFKRITQS